MKINEKELEEICKKLLNSVVINKAHPINDINLFSILNIENKEVYAHSRFLYYIFSPFIDENSNRDDKNLRELFKQLHPNAAEPEFIDIQQEVVTDFGRLDFLILYETNGKKDASVIELKNQLFFYGSGEKIRTLDIGVRGQNVTVILHRYVLN